MMLGKPIELKDMESVDSEYYNSLLWIQVRGNAYCSIDVVFAVLFVNFMSALVIMLRYDSAPRESECMCILLSLPLP